MHFLTPDQEQMLQPLEPKTYISKASQELHHLIFHTDKRILVLTDYDADGISSAVISYKMLSKVLQQDRFLIRTNKRKFGNGINLSFLETIPDLNQFDVLITADHGSSNESVLKELKENNPNLKIFLTDHHTFRKENYPHSADYFINNQLETYDEIPEDERKSWNVFKDSSGCIMVFFLLLQTLKDKIKLEEIYREVLPFLAITIISDVMSVDHPLNRYIVKKGLRIINDERSSFFYILREFLRLEPIYSIDTLRYVLSPLINTGNRQHCEELVYQLLISQNHDEILSKLSELSIRNNERKKLTNDLVTHITLSNKLMGDSGLSIIVKTEMGINGIIAAKIGEIYQKPTICFLEIDQHYHGSVRGIIPGYDVIEILDQLHRDGLIKIYGGHKEAAGCLVEKEHIDSFRQKFNEYTRNKINTLPKNDLVEVFRILSPNEITLNNIMNLNQLEPYGKNFSDPLFYSELTIKTCFTSKSMSFLKFEELLFNIQGVAYKNGKYLHEEILREGNKIGVVYTMKLGYFRNTYQCGLNIINAKLVGV